MTKIENYAIGWQYRWNPDYDYTDSASERVLFEKFANLPTICCYKDSAVYYYAIQNGIPYELLEEIGQPTDPDEKDPSDPGINKPSDQGTDYTVSYKNNKNIGTTTVTVTGKGNYTGTAKKTFQITAKKG